MRKENLDDTVSHAKKFAFYSKSKIVPLMDLGQTIELVIFIFSEISNGLKFKNRNGVGWGKKERE